MAMSGCEIDAFVGSRIRMRREALQISQRSLGGHLGLTFSQIQKYEKGSNRIGAGRLYQIASYLGVTVSDFFEGLERPAETSNKKIGPPRDEVRHLTEAFVSIPDSEIRASVLALVRSLAPNPESIPLSRIDRPAVQAPRWPRFPPLSRLAGRRRSWHRD